MESHRATLLFLALLCVCVTELASSPFSGFMGVRLVLGFVAGAVLSSIVACCTLLEVEWEERIGVKEQKQTAVGCIRECSSTAERQQELQRCESRFSSADEELLSLQTDSLENVHLLEASREQLRLERQAVQKLQAEASALQRAYQDLVGETEGPRTENKRLKAQKVSLHRMYRENELLIAMAGKNQKLARENSIMKSQLYQDKTAASENLMLLWTVRRLEAEVKASGISSAGDDAHALAAEIVSPHPGLRDVPRHQPRASAYRPFTKHEIPLVMEIHLRRLEMLIAEEGLGLDDNN